MASSSRNQPQKRKALTLDLNAATNKKSKAAPHILTSPDVQMLKLTSPELAEFLTRNPALNTPTPSGNNILFPKHVTEEQEIYVKGFEVALKNLQQGKNDTNQVPIQSFKSEPSSIETTIETIERATAAHRAKLASEVSPRPSSSASGSMDSSEFRIKEENIDDDDDDDNDESDDYSDDEDLPTTSRKKAGRKPNNKLLGMNPINMVSQEKIKLERKRQRNRLAASKCRKRKLERISHLELKVRDLKGENAELANVVKKLKDSVYGLKQEVLEHHNNGCLISMVGEEIVYNTTTSS